MIRTLIFLPLDDCHSKIYTEAFAFKYECMYNVVIESLAIRYVHALHIWRETTINCYFLIYTFNLLAQRSSAWIPE